MSARSEARWKKRVQAENNERDALIGMIEAAALTRTPRAAIPALPRNHNRAYVRQWMNANANEYTSATELAEAANAALRLPADCLDDETHWIWEEALNAMEREIEKAMRICDENK